MQVFRGFHHPGLAAASAVTIGNFDGVHRGHQAMLALLTNEARHRQVASCVLTFEPHPRDFFARRLGRPESAPARIAGLRDKLHELERCGIDQAVVLRFDEQLATQQPQDFIDQVPLGRRLFASSNPVRTGGPMQVSVEFAQRYAREHGYPHDEGESVRHAVFTRRGGLYFGIAHLLDYRNAYDRHIYRFADFNAGWHASRNAAFQSALGVATGRRLALDGDLVADGVGETERAARTLGASLGLDDRAIRRALERGAGADFEQTALYRGVFALAQARSGRPQPGRASTGVGSDLVVIRGGRASGHVQEGGGRRVLNRRGTMTRATRLSPAAGVQEALDQTVFERMEGNDSKAATGAKQIFCSA